LAGSAIVVMVCLVLRSADVQVVRGADLRADGVNQRESYVKVPAARGSIFDRDGNELAVTVPALSLYANPQAIVDPVASAQVLAQMLGLDLVSEGELAAKLANRSSTFVYVQRFVDPALVESVLALQLSGVNSVTEPKRVQVAGTLARNVIGRTDPFGEGSTGLELQYDKILRGVDGRTVRDSSRGRSMPGTSRTVTEARPGTDLVLTIDRSMQFQTEQALIARVSELKARGGNAVIMDTATGEVLAIVSVRRDVDGQVSVTNGNLAAVESYEPGSVAKIFSIAAAIDSGTATPATTYEVPGVYEFDPGTEFAMTITDAYPHDLQTMSLRDVIVDSSNIGTLMAAEPMGSQRLYDYLVDFGFGKLTDIDFPGESSGVLKPAKKWQGSENATVTYGYGFSATSLQLVSAVNAVANGGTYVSPRFIKATIDEDGSLWDTPIGTTRRVVSEATAEVMAELLKAVVCEGTGERARVTGLSVAGKTGTGYKIQDNGTYQSDSGSRAYFATFVGFVPAYDPVVTILVSIDEPDPSSRDRFGGTAAAPVFAKLAEMTVHERSIEPAVGDNGCDLAP
jgi:cell division protein FtsI (penicillin-binding protein 3)